MMDGAGIRFIRHDNCLFVIFMRKTVIILVLTLTLPLLSRVNVSYAIPVNLGAAAPVNAPYPYTHVDRLDDSNDIDYYKFYANAGDALTIDIDNGYDGSDGNMFTAFTEGVDIDILLTLFDVNQTFIPYPTFGFNGFGAAMAADGGNIIDAGSYPIYTGSGYTNDPYISYIIPDTGIYYLAVSTNNNFYDTCTGCAGEFHGDALNVYPYGGDYTLIIDGITGNVSVPEPSTLLLSAVGLFGLLFLRLDIFRRYS